MDEAVSIKVGECQQACFCYVEKSVGRKNGKRYTGKTEWELERRYLPVYEITVSAKTKIHLLLRFHSGLASHTCAINCSNPKLVQW